MKISRRKFIGTSALASSSLFIPQFLKGFERNISLASTEGKALVIIQLSGGNDGLNTVVPYRNDIYYSQRPQIAIQPAGILKLNDELGFNPALQSLHKIYEQGWLTVLNSVGYPNPDLSHFRSMDIWHTASSSDHFIPTGWVGRYLDSQCPGCNAHDAIELDDTLSLALKGQNVNGLAVSDPQKLYAATRDPDFKKAAGAQSHENETLDYLYKVMGETMSSAGYIYDRSKIYKSKEIYPANQFGNDLKTIAELIVSGSETRVYYVSLSGFDTHVQQSRVQENLLKNVSDSLLVFVNDLKNNNRLDDTVIMTFSEFGRRVKQNASGGTDHGTANNIFIIGGKLKKKGVYNASPDLKDLDDGNLKHEVDFRQVYATLLNKVLGANDEKILARKFLQLEFI